MYKIKGSDAMDSEMLTYIQKQKEKYQNFSLSLIHISEPTRPY